MINTLLWGFTKEYSPTVRYLREGGVCDVRVWIGSDKECTHSRKDFMTMRFKYESPELCDEAVYETVFRNYYAYLDRTNTFNRMNQHNIYEYLNLFNRQINYFYHLLKSEGIQLVVLNRPPHYGPDTILYEVARAMGLKILILCPSFFEDRFWYCFDMDDYGRFADVPEVLPYPEVTLEKKHEKFIPYHLNIPEYRYSVWQAIRDFSQGKLTAFQKLAEYRKFKRNLNAMIDPHIDLSQKFVYFPLHLQPELSTSTLGGLYCDQVLALERLSRLLPDDFYIYAKDHLLQTEFMRDENYFDRLRAIPNLRLTPTTMSTYELIRHSQFVATIAGTVGWEAITGGKNVLLFGQTWYMTLPGVFQFNDTFRLEHILNYQLAHDTLERAVGKLQSRMGRGVLSHEYYPLKDFDAERNGQRLAEFLHQAAGHLFGASGPTSQSARHDGRLSVPR